MDTVNIRKVVTMTLRETLEFAKDAHAGQMRKFTRELYIFHPIRVAGLVTKANGTLEMVQAALLHDVVEDTPVTLMEIQETFGEDVADLVYWMTNPSRPGDGNRAQRRKIDKDFNAQAPHKAKVVRLADICDNLNDIHLAGDEFTRLYVKEKRDLLTVLSGVHAGLYTLAHIRATDALMRAQKL